MKMKSAILFVVLASGLTASVFATESVVPTSLNHASQSDVLSLFEADSRPLQLAVLSPKEMKETEGAWIQFAVGGAIGAATYGWGYYRGQYDWNTTRFLGNVGSGALIGGTFGALGGLASGGARFIPSLTNAGANIWRFNSLTANFGANQYWRR